MGRRGVKATDVVIPYKKTHDDLELRYALRSIEKNLEGLGLIFIVGDKPDWIQNVQYIPNTNRDHKGVNVGHALRMAMWREDLSENFLIWHDDMFLLERIKDIPVWHGKSIKEFSKTYNSIYPTSYYTRKIDDTDIDKELPHFELHIPMMANKILLSNQLRDEPRARRYLMRTLYFIENVPEDQWEYHEDVKIHSYSGSRGWQDNERFKTFVSSADNVFLGVVYPILKDMFPDKSIYEK